MSIQYRAIWQDDRPDLIDTGIDIFQEWINTKNIELNIPTEGIVSNESNEIRVDHVSEGTIQALRICLDESRPKAKVIQKWTTIAHWMTDGTNGWIWIDLEYESSDISYPPKVFAPKLVTMLLEARDPSADYPHLGPQPLRISSKGDIDNLINSLYDKERSIPIIVYSIDPTLTKRKCEERVNSAARRLAGCADIRMLTKDTQDIFHNWLDPISMSVFGGATRIYLPGIDPYDPAPWKHRYIQSRFLSEDPLQASYTVARRILPRIIAQSPPLIYDKIRHSFGSKNRDWEEYAMDLDKKFTLLTKRHQQLTKEKEEIELARDLAIEEAAESEKQADIFTVLLDRMRKKLRKLDKNPDVIEQTAREQITIPNSCREAIDLAGALEYIMIHPKAPQDISRMDRNEDSKLWARRIYRFLQSLNFYSEQKDSGFNGGFVEWCNNSGSPHAISASKFVAMNESEYVRNNKYSKSLRNLPIDKSVDPSGIIQMKSHLKPIQGGGMTIPRIYFHDDTKGKTGKVHIGFIGPHDLMSNASAN